MTGKSTRGNCRIGTSGYQYPHWRGPVYPQDMPKKDWFDYYCRHFDTVEINNTFYGLPGIETFQKWHDATPRGFEYALKVSRYLTHIKYLKDPDEPIQRFLDHARPLQDMLGPLLVQLPPNWQINLERLDGFLACLPEGYRWTLEFRHPSWLDERVISRLRDAGIGLCIHDMIPDHPFLATSDWLYLRYHGEDYTHNYSHQFLSAQADKLSGWVKDGNDLYAYFNNDNEGYAFHNALQLLRYLKHRL